MEQIMIMSNENIGSALDEARGEYLEKFGVKPSEFIGGHGPVYALGVMVALAAKIQSASMKKRPNRGIAEQFMKPPIRPRETLGRLTGVVTPHVTKMSKGGETYSVKMYKSISRMLSKEDLPLRLRVSDNFDYVKGMYDVGAILNDLWKKSDSDHGNVTSNDVTEQDQD